MATKFRILNRPAHTYGWKMCLWFACRKLYGVNVKGSLNHTEFKEEIVISFSPFTIFPTSTISSPPTIPSQNTWNVSTKRRASQDFALLDYRRLSPLAQSQMQKTKWNQFIPRNIVTRNEAKSDVAWINYWRRKLRRKDRKFRERKNAVVPRILRGRLGAL